MSGKIRPKQKLSGNIIYGDVHGAEAFADSLVMLDDLERLVNEKRTEDEAARTPEPPEEKIEDET